MDSNPEILLSLCLSQHPAAPALLGVLPSSSSVWESLQVAADGGSILQPSVMGLLYRQRPHALQSSLLKVFQAYLADLSNKGIVCQLPRVPLLHAKDKGNNPQKFSVSNSIVDDRGQLDDASFKTHDRSALHSNRDGGSGDHTNTSSNPASAPSPLKPGFDVTGTLPDSLMFWTRSRIVEAVVESPTQLKHCLDALYCLFLDSNFSLATFRLTKDFYMRLMIVSGLTLEKHLPSECQGILSVLSENEALSVDRIDKSVIRFVDCEIIRLIGDAVPLAVLYGILALFPRWITNLRGEASLSLLFSCFGKDSLSR